MHRRSADEVAAVLRFANEHGLSVVPAGGFTQQQTGNLAFPGGCAFCKPHRLTEVEHYDPGRPYRWRRSRLHGCATVCHGGSEWIAFRRRCGSSGAFHHRRTAGDSHARASATGLWRAPRLLHRNQVCDRRRPQGQGRRPRSKECCRLRLDEAPYRQPGEFGGHYQRQLQIVSRAPADADFCRRVRCDFARR